MKGIVTLRAAEAPFFPLGAEAAAPRRRKRPLEGIKRRIGAEILARASEQAKFFPGMCAAAGLTAGEMAALIGSDASSLPLRRLWSAVRRLRRSAVPPYDPVLHRW